MSPRLKRLTVATAVAAMLVPAGSATARRGGEDRADRQERQTQRDERRQAREERREAREQARAERRRNRAKHHQVRGTVTAVDATAGTLTVAVTGGNRAGRRFKGEEVTFTVADARVKVADVNGDGSADLGDVAVGDRVKVDARIRRSAQAADGPFAARRVLDLTNPPVEDDDEDGDDTPAPAPTEPVAGS